MTHRLRFDFDDGAYQRLQDLRVYLHSDTNAEVVRAALRTYEWLVEMVKEGKETIWFDYGDSFPLSEVVRTS